MTDLNKLAERVEAGEVTNPEISVALHLPPANAEAWIKNWNNYEILSATRVVLKHNDGSNGANWAAPNFLRSLDAAKALHNAVLPGWRVASMWEDEKAKDRPWWGVKLCRDEPYLMMPSVLGAPNPAAAWVAAILRAKAQDKPNG